MAFSLTNPFGSARTQDASGEFRANMLEALSMARNAAAQRGDERFTLEDYFQAAQSLGQAKGLDPAQWNAKTFGNFALLNEPNKPFELTGVQLQDPKLANKAPQITKGHNFMDSDGDHTINDFYTNLNFTGINLKDCFVEPATSFNDQIQKAKELDNVTFKQLRKGDTLAFGDGTANNIHIEDCKGGSFRFNGTHVEKLNMEGALVTNFELSKGASINGINADDAHFVHINGESATAISGSHFRHATITNDSKMQGMILTNVDFSHASMEDVDLSGAQLTGVTLPMDLKGVNLKNAQLTNVKLEDGTAVNSLEQLHDLGATISPNTRIQQAGKQPQGAAKESPAPAMPSANKEAPAQFAGLNLDLAAFRPATPILDVAPAKLDEVHHGNPIMAKNEQRAPQPKESPDKGYYARKSEEYAARNPGKTTTHA